MIGMVNVQCDSPIDYYSSAPSRKGSQRVKEDQAASKPLAKRTPSWRPLFTQGKKKLHPKYLEDGRKVNSENDQVEPNKLWEELFLRSFAHKMEEEIASPSPLDAHKNLDTELAKLNIKGSDKSLYRSTYSLVSEARVEDTDFDELTTQMDDEMKPIRSNSACDRTAALFAPFIKSIKGNKKKTSLNQ